VLPLSQFLLLQTAAPDAIVRLQNTPLEEQKTVEEMYFKKLHLHSIEEFLIDQLQRCEGKGGLLIQVHTCAVVHVRRSVLPMTIFFKKIGVFFPFR
jgi:hypothetical protein